MVVVNGKRYRIKWRNVAILLLILIFFIGIVYSSINLIIWAVDNNKTKVEINSIEEKVDIEEINDSEETEIIEPEEIPNEFNPYWDYVNMKLIDVDFDELKRVNSDVKGWIQLGGTNINYPFVQGNDNKNYLSHSFNKSYNKAGWVFLDYRNHGKTNDKNTIIYAHALKTGSMFGTLKDILKSSWQNNTNNHIVKMSTEEENTLWQVFSIYTIPTTSDYIQVDFDDNADFIDFINKISDRSVYNFNTSVNENDKILTLSSCYINSDNKIVLHAKLIKRQNKVYIN